MLAVEQNHEVELQLARPCRAVLHGILSFAVLTLRGPYIRKILKR